WKTRATSRRARTCCSWRRTSSASATTPPTSPKACGTRSPANRSPPSAPSATSLRAPSCRSWATAGIEARQRFTPPALWERTLCANALALDRGQKHSRTGCAPTAFRSTAQASIDHPPRTPQLHPARNAIDANRNPCHFQPERRPVEAAERQRQQHAERAKDVHELVGQLVAVQLAGLQQEIRQQHQQHADVAGPVVPVEGHRSPLLCRRASNNTTPVATETLRLSIAPGMGIFAVKSQVSRVSRRMPSPSLPITSATGPLRSMP